MVNISSAIIFNDNFTTEEVMAIIMHELGHNYYAALNKRFGVMEQLLAIVNFFIYFSNVNTIIYELGIDKAYIKYEQEMKKSGKLSILVTSVEFV
jgi:Zn-dependent protease with chaperone function